jgi:STAS domain
VIVTIPAPVARGDAQGLCQRVGDALARSRADTVVCDAHELTDPDAAAVDAVLRLYLAARRHGCRFELRRPPPPLLHMLTLAGMCELFGLEMLGVGMVGQPEQREQPGRVEKRRDPGDSSV